MKFLELNHTPERCILVDTFSQIHLFRLIIIYFPQLTEEPPLDGGGRIFHLFMILTKDVEVKITRKLENNANLTNNLQDMEIGNNFILLKISLRRNLFL